METIIILLIKNSLTYAKDIFKPILLNFDKVMVYDHIMNINYYVEKVL